MIYVAQPSIGQDEKSAVAACLDGGWITMGERVRQFEVAFAEAHGANDSVAVSSCTAGLHLVLHALGVGPGDEVLVPSLTFVATANAVLYVGANPVFVDIRSASLPLMSIEEASAKCTPRTRAIILVHYAGYAIDLAKWREFAASRNLLLIEDAAHAAGHREVGVSSDAAVFSFYGNKNITTAEGGAVISADPELLDRVRQMRGHGLTSGTFQRHANGNPTYDVTMLGFNYRMDELRAAIGLVQLTKLGDWNERRRHLTKVYRSRMRSLAPEVIAPFEPDEATSCHIMPVVLPRGVDRLRIIKSMRDSGVQTSIHYPPVHLLSLYRSRTPSLRLPITEDFAARELTLPLHPGLVEADIEQVVRSLVKGIAELREGVSANA